MSSLFDPLVADFAAAPIAVRVRRAPPTNLPPSPLPAAAGCVKSERALLRLAPPPATNVQRYPPCEPTGNSKTQLPVDALPAGRRTPTDRHPMVIPVRRPKIGLQVHGGDRPTTGGLVSRRRADGPVNKPPPKKNALTKSGVGKAAAPLADRSGKPG